MLPFEDLNLKKKIHSALLTPSKVIAIIILLLKGHCVVLEKKFKLSILIFTVFMR